MRRWQSFYHPVFFLALLVLHALLLAQPGALFARHQGLNSAIVQPSANYTAAILMEPQTGQILLQQEIHKVWPAASLTKMMLMLLVMEKVEDKSLVLTDRVEVSRRASKMGGSQVYLEPGEVFTVEQLMKAIVIHSANDAAQALAEWIAGSSDAFVSLMNRRAAELGLKATIYHNVHGLPPERGQSSSLTSAYDTAILARALVRYPEILRWGSTEKEPFRGGEFILENTNRLIGRFAGADGLKTGYSREAGFNLAATAARDGARFIAVVLGAPTNRTRFREAARLLSMGFDEFKLVTVMKAGETVAEQLRIRGGVIDRLQPVLNEPAWVVVPRAQEKAVKSNIRLRDSVWAPLRKGDKIGELIVTNGDHPLGKFSLVSDRDIQQSNIFKRLWDRFF